VDPAGWKVLIGSYLPRLKRFAQRYLPAGSRGAIGADDVVQEAVMRSLRQLNRFEFRHDEAFLAYLRKSIRHRIVDEIRRAHRRPALIALGTRESIDRGVSPLERLIAKSRMRRYRDQLATLSDRDRRLIVLRVEQGLSYADVAARLGMRTESAARMAITRAIHRLGAKMKRQVRLKPATTMAVRLKPDRTSTSAIGLADAVEIHSRMAGSGDAPGAGVRAAS
jgi:RNA polymerase sigma-70 factor (ECF subfamily)